MHNYNNYILILFAHVKNCIPTHLQNSLLFWQYYVKAFILPTIYYTTISIHLCKKQKKYGLGLTEKLCRYKVAKGLGMLHELVIDIYINNNSDKFINFSGF